MFYYEQPPTEEELQVRAAYAFRTNYRDNALFLKTTQEYTAESLILESKERLNRKLKRLRKTFSQNAEALDVLAELEYLK